MPKTEYRNVVWIDCAKFVAIIAVLVDHLKGVLYETETVQYIFFFSVALFFFLSGMTVFYSLQRRKETEAFSQWTMKRLAKILLPYLGAVAVYQFVKSGYTWNLGQFVLWALNFNLEGQFYFVLIYLQFILAAPVLYLITVSCGKGRFRALWRILYLAAAWVVSMFSMNHTLMLETYGGGKYLLGGTYLFLFVMGMIAADMKPSLRTKKGAAMATAASAVFFGAVLAFLLTDRLAFDESLYGWALRVNPPGITLIVYTLALVLLLFSACSLAGLLKNRVVDGIMGIFARLGKFTLYIFLYHTLVMDTLLPSLSFVQVLPQGVKIVIYLVAMLGLPAGGKVLYDWIRRFLLKNAAIRKSGR